MSNYPSKRCEWSSERQSGEKSGNSLGVPKLEKVPTRKSIPLSHSRLFRYSLYPNDSGIDVAGAWHLARPGRRQAQGVGDATDRAVGAVKPKLIVLSGATRKLLDIPSKGLCCQLDSFDHS